MAGGRSRSRWPCCSGSLRCLGLFGAFKALPYVLSVVALGSGDMGVHPRVAPGGRGGRGQRLGTAAPPAPPESEDPRRPSGRVAATLIALAIAALAVVHFAANARLRLSTGMTGFDSTWYHGPFAAGFFQSGDTWSLHFIAPQFLAWFYPANSEIFHAIGMAAFGRDILSPLLNLGWFVGCLFAAWCIGRPYRVAPWSLALGAIALSVPALSDQAGEARNDIVGIFFLLAAVAVAVNAWQVRSDRGLSTGALVVVGFAAGLAAGTKLNFLLPAATLVIGLTAIAPSGRRWRSLAAVGLAALAGGGYWYLRNLAHTGNPLPWVRHLGPISLPAPGQALGGREGHSVLGYLTDGSVWSDWFLPGLHHGLTVFWPLFVALALAGLLGCFTRGSGPLLRVDRSHRPGGDRRLADRPDLSLGSRRHAPRLRIGPPLPGSQPGSRLGACSRCLARTLPCDRRGEPLERADTQSAEPIGSALVRARGSPRLSRTGWSRTDRLRLPRAAPLPAAPLRESHLHHSRPQRRLQVGPVDLGRPHSDDEHPPVPPLRPRPLQPRPVRRHPNPPRRLRRPHRPAPNGAASSTKATTTT